MQKENVLLNYVCYVLFSAKVYPSTRFRENKDKRMEGIC